jgi:HD-GYP domain-containing protein (c-di-GMP phosphodiesterase class II)
MKSLAANLLKPGMVFAKPVFIDKETILVKAGDPVTQKDLDHLQAQGIETVLADGIPSFIAEEDAGTPAEATDTLNSPHPLLIMHEHTGAYRSYMSFIDRVNIALLRISSKDAITDSNSISIISTQILQAVRNQPEEFVGFILGGDVKGYEMAKSSVNTAILSALVAHELKYPNHKTLGIIIGALLHDAGMLRLPKEITEKRGELSDMERKLMHTHPLIAYKIITKEFRYNEEVGTVVLQHHERWDGKGYPFGFVGNKIHVGARIVSIADAFEAMVSHKPYRNPIIGYQAIKNLLADNSRRFDPFLLKGFVNIMGLYPIGSIVLLNNGVIARVTESHADTPLRPTVRILVDENKNAYKDGKGLCIDLLAEKNLYITRAMTEKELAELYG